MTFPVGGNCPLDDFSVTRGSVDHHTASDIDPGVADGRRIIIAEKQDIALFNIAVGDNLFPVLLF